MKNIFISYLMMILFLSSSCSSLHTYHFGVQNRVTWSR
jgi:hypothetical protein